MTCCLCCKYYANLIGAHGLRSTKRSFGLNIAFFGIGGGGYEAWYAMMRLRLGKESAVVVISLLTDLVICVGTLAFEKWVSEHPDHGLSEEELTAYKEELCK